MTLRAAAFVSAAFLVCAGPAWAGNFQIYEHQYGGPGATAELGAGSLSADIDFDADSAEGGGLATGATEIEIRPTGSVVFLSFDCELAGCAQDVDYVFSPGDAASGARIVVSDSGISERHGIHHLGTIDIDAPSGSGSIELLDCNYIGADAVERSCDPFTLATLPEPASASGLAAGAALLWLLGRRRRLLA